MTEKLTPLAILAEEPHGLLLLKGGLRVSPPSSAVLQSIDSPRNILVTSPPPKGSMV